MIGEPYNIDSVEHCYNICIGWETAGICYQNQPQHVYTMKCTHTCIYHNMYMYISQHEHVYTITYTYHNMYTPRHVHVHIITCTLHNMYTP